MAKTPPSRSYKLFSGMVGAACAYALSIPANTATWAALSPATTLRLVMDAESSRAMATSLVMGNAERPAGNAGGLFVPRDGAECSRIEKRGLLRS